MAASTITRTTWTNDTGTPTTPVGDGTVLNNARLQDIYAAIDQLFSGAGAYATFTLGGLLAVEGFGTHGCSAGGSGGQILRVRNTTAGAANFAALHVGNDAAQANLAIMSFSSTYTSTATYLADGAGIEATRAGGLSVIASHASGALRFYSANTERVRIAADGKVGIGTTAPTGGLTIAAGTVVAEGAAVSAPTGLTINGTISSPDFAQLVFGDGTGYRLNFGTRSGGNFATRFQIYDNGAIRHADGSASVPSVSFINDVDTGLYLVSAVTGNIAVTGGGTAWLNLVSNISHLYMLDRALGTGVTVGPYITIGRNSSGTGSAGHLKFTRKGGTVDVAWVDNSGNMRIHSAAPSEDNTTVSDTAGTVVGTQTSTRATKRDITPFTDQTGALALLRRTPVYRFRYRNQDPDTDHVGILADESPEFTRYGQTTFDPVNAFGYTVAALQALVARVETLEAALSGTR